ncbi:hypothetical protein SAMN02910353_02339 [Ruminococcus sp. YRD2003]|nr:hypothetical protein SAMN02910353_02339 [Ruminococcus flavefaciens]
MHFAWRPDVCPANLPYMSGGIVGGTVQITKYNEMDGFFEIFS